MKKVKTESPAVLFHIQNDVWREYDIKTTIRIGRASCNEIPVADPTLLSTQVKITNKDDQIYLETISNNYPALVNGTTVFQAQLQHGDRINLGNHHFLFSRNRNHLSNRLLLNSKNSTWNSRLQKIPSIAKSDSPVLLQGPSGTGKELLAREIHHLSNRSSGPFICINCSALNESLSASELFGHKKGSFTDANTDRKGAFEMARGGTLFLDEIGDLPPSIQPKLLRTLEMGEIHPIGSDKIMKTDVRIITATHKFLYQEIQAGTFREDLFHRINTIVFKIPSLNQRLEDFDDLLALFCQRYRVRFQLSAINYLKEHEWRGNIRELRNMVERAAALYPNQTISLEHVNDITQTTWHEPTPTFDSREAALPMIKRIEKSLIYENLIKYQGNQTRVAQFLGIPKSTLHDRIRTYNINLEELKKHTMDI